MATPTKPVDTTAPLDRLSSLLERFRVRTHLFHSGPLCGVTHFDAQPGRGFLHVLRRGSMVVTHRPRRGAPRRIVVNEPSLLFYPRPLAHDFHNAPSEGSDFVCATLDFDRGASHPLARALPALVVLSLREVAGLDHTLALLFTETERLRCGQRLLADRLFEVLLLQLLRWLLDHPDTCCCFRSLRTCSPGWPTPSWPAHWWPCMSSPVGPGHWIQWRIRRACRAARLQLHSRPK
jgi:hypothetical protein